jgi:hypothetical protein
MITREDYLAGRAAHRAYYGEVLDASGVRLDPGHEAALLAAASRDPHYNDVPLAVWDAND